MFFKNNKILKREKDSTWYILLRDVLSSTFRLFHACALILYVQDSFARKSGCPILPLSWLQKLLLSNYTEEEFQVRALALPLVGNWEIRSVHTNLVFVQNYLHPFGWVEDVASGTKKVEYSYLATPGNLSKPSLKKYLNCGSKKKCWKSLCISIHWI